MGPPGLSTTALLELLMQGKEPEFVRDVMGHLAVWPSDDVSALKALKTLAFVLYERSLRREGRAGLVDTAVKCTHVIAAAANGGLSDTVAMDVIGALFHVLSRQGVEVDEVLAEQVHIDVPKGSLPYSICWPVAGMGY